MEDHTQHQQGMQHHHEQMQHEMQAPKHPWLITIGSFLFFLLIAYLSSFIAPIKF